MTRRPGLSLVEVLSALFIMGVGLISLFTLFPYGALQYAASFKDDRTAQCAAAAEAYMRIYWKERVLEFHPNSAQEAFPLAMDDPNSDPNEGIGRVPLTIQKPAQPMAPGTPEPVPPLTAGLTDPSYPVFVDPMGWVARPTAVGSGKWWVSDTTVPTEGRPPRRNLFEIERFVSRPPLPANPAGTATANLLSLRLCSMLDGLTYAPDGRAADATGVSAELSGGVVQRELRYNWLWVLQRQNNTDRTSAKMTVVVFDKRSHLYAPTSSELAYVPDPSSTLAAGDTAVRFQAGAEPPGLKKGSWLVDVTTLSDFFTIPGPVGSPPRNVYFSTIRNANFYRVVSVTANGGVVDVEMHQPLKPDSKTRFRPDTGAPIPDATPGQRRFVVLSGVADVFEKNPLANSNAGP